MSFLVGYFSLVIFVERLTSAYPFQIGDLGLSKVKQRTLVSGGVRGTIPWMAPELLSGKNLVSEKVGGYNSYQL